MGKRRGAGCMAVPWSPESPWNISRTSTYAHRPWGTRPTQIPLRAGTLLVRRRLAGGALCPAAATTERAEALGALVFAVLIKPGTAAGIATLVIASAVCLGLLDPADGRLDGLLDAPRLRGEGHRRQARGIGDLWERRGSRVGATHSGLQPSIIHAMAKPNAVITSSGKNVLKMLAFIAVMHSSRLGPDGAVIVGWSHSR